MVRRCLKTALPGLLFLCCVATARPQNFSSGPLNDSGKVDRRRPPHVLHHPPSSRQLVSPTPAGRAGNAHTPRLPHSANLRGAPPENVVHASLEQRGSSDWAVLCSASGTVSLLVFFSGQYTDPTLSPRRPKPSACSHTAQAAFSASTGASTRHRPEQVHEAQLGMRHLPPRLDHDALADSVIDHHTVYHFYSQGTWTLLILRTSIASELVPERLDLCRPRHLTMSQQVAALF